PGLPVIILTAHGSIPNAVEAMQRGATGYLTKPFDDKELKASLEKALSQQRMSREIQRLKLLVKELYGMENVVARSPQMQRLFQQIAQVADTDATICLLGETGTGKEVVARAIHSRSDRRDKPFIRVNCGAIPPELIDSQLFGHEKGSFTGAAETRPGWFERADGGTLFLDEIGELPSDAQVRFLRVLQDSFIERVGGREPIRVDVRVVAATHRDLSSMARDGRFREDLWYRIAVFPILLPPLRERLDDIPELAAHFAQRAAVRFGLTAVEPSREDVEKLQSYHWPGNIRELGAVIDRAAILGEGRTLEIDAALGFGADAAVRPSFAPRSGEPAQAAAVVRTVVPLNVAMAEHIRAALRQSHGRIEGPRGAAAVLKINPHTLRARMRKLGVDWATFRER
ncbi:MAG: Fis family transcriptional regulator, partial [Planctomycetota bacterium]